jgi:putative ABC transport system ATP-binding protein
MIYDDPEMIQLTDVSMHYGTGPGRLQVLKDVDLRVRQGTRVAITGPSGSGKSTLLLLLAGLEQPTSGAVRLDGRLLNELSSDQLADLRRDHIGIVFQFFHLVPSLTALENVALPLEIARKGDARERARALLGRVGLSGRLGHYPSQLSGGEQQRVAIARALVHAPKLILADEPTGNLDDHTGRSVGELLFDMHRQSEATLVLVTHDVELAGGCDRVLRLHDGILHQLPAERPEHVVRA